MYLPCIWPRVWESPGRHTCNWGLYKVVPGEGSRPEPALPGKGRAGGKRDWGKTGWWEPLGSWLALVRQSRDGHHRVCVLTAGATSLPAQEQALV
jgi:hypothetical protein